MINSVPSLALVVEDDQFQREMLSDLLKDEDMEVIACESAEAAELVLEEVGEWLRVLVTDVELAGRETGIELAGHAKRHFPLLNVVIISGKDDLSLPPDVHFLKKPWQPLDLLREAMG
jgi:DNA-binding NtrC family response regulator